MRIVIGAVVFGLLIATIGCETTSTIVNEDSSLKIFRLAQDAYADANYELAHDYYVLIANDGNYARQHVVSAQYELAYIAYKTGNIQQAYDEFNTLIAEYYLDSTNFPQWILILSEKMTARISNLLNSPN